jgi:7,8-dihydropterin-6-yl-methyl-4-(beta-D-ribofuranosyl)aminobenzene 5'-phosphate synthase
MMTRRHLLQGAAATAIAPHLFKGAHAQESATRLTILFDAFGRPSSLKRGWGYSALVEYGGQRVLFDTGGRAAEFAHNVSALGVDLKRLDFVVLSHRHNDHTAGLNQVLAENPSVTIYTPIEVGGFDTPASAPLMRLIKRDVVSVSRDLSYFGGNVPAEIRFDPPWPNAHFMQIRDPKEVSPGFFLLSTRSERPGTLEMNEVSLLIKTSRGGVLVVGCAHPGIEKIIEAATKIEPQIYAVAGGFHLVDITDAEVTAMVMRFRDKWRIERMAAGHCTGQFAFAELERVYNANFDHAGVGSVIALPS